MADIVMPRLSDTMEEGTILRWLVAEGEQVARGQDLVEIETDKATMVYQSDQQGTLRRVAGEGDTLAVGELIARVGSATDIHDDGPAPQGPAGMGVRSASTPEGGAPGAAPSPPAPPRAAPAAGVEAAPPAPLPAPPRAAPAAGERVRASPLARRMAQESGLDLHAIAGSGPGGRIVKADVQAAAAGTSGTAAAAAPPGATPAPAAGGAPASATGGTATEPASAGTPALAEVARAKGETTLVALTRTQRTIARRMAESKATIPHFTLQCEVDMERCAELRAELKRLSPQEAPTYNDMVVKASALALREHPRANGSYRDGQLQLHSRVNVGVAVAAQEALVVPTVFDADAKALGEIARETRALAQRVREATITPPELGGGTFTVSNLGMYGVSAFSAIINPPQAAILSVGALAQRAVAREGQLALAHTMTLTLACDHRILYGADAAHFLARIRELLEAPAALTL